MEKELLARIELLESKFIALENSTTIPLEIDRSFRDRFGDIVASLSVSSKGVNTEDQSVNEGGSATYSVMGDPDGFLQITINGTIYYIPYFS